MQYMRRPTTFLFDKMFDGDMIIECCTRFVKHGKEVLKLQDISTLSFGTLCVKGCSAVKCLSMVCIFFIYLIPFVCELVKFVERNVTSPLDPTLHHNAILSLMVLKLTKEEDKLKYDCQESESVRL